MIITLLQFFLWNFHEKGKTILISDPEMICFGTPHRYYLFAGIIGLLIYLPVSLVIFPNFQFQDKALDIKYEPYYVVLQTVLELFLSRNSGSHLINLNMIFFL